MRGSNKNMKDIMRLIVIALLFTVLTGCSYFSDSSVFRSNDRAYLTAQSIPPLKIPPGISSNAFQNYYPVSYREYPGNKDVSLKPVGL